MLFETEDGKAFVHLENGKHIIHSELTGGYTSKTLPLAFAASEMIDEAFREKGVDKLYTWGYTEAHDKYNKILGYQPNGNIVEVNNWDGPTIYEYEKEL